MGFTGLALGALLVKDGVARAAGAKHGPESGPRSDTALTISLLVRSSGDHRGSVLVSRQSSIAG